MAPSAIPELLLEGSRLEEAGDQLRGSIVEVGVDPGVVEDGEADVPQSVSEISGEPTPLVGSAAQEQTEIAASDTVLVVESLSAGAFRQLVVLTLLDLIVPDEIAIGRLNSLFLLRHVDLPIGIG